MFDVHKMELNNNCLELSGYDISANEVAEIIHILHQNKIRELHLLDVNLTSYLREIFNAVSVNTSLQILNLKCNDIGTAASDLAEMLRTNIYLMSLSLECCKINCDAFTEIADSLTNNTTLQKINLYCNNIGSLGALKLADVLRTNNSLQNICLANNNIMADGIMELADSLCVNNTLRELDVCDNVIDADVLSRFANMININDTLQILHLGGNYIIQELNDDITDFASALSQNNTLRTLRLGDVGENAIIKIANAMHTNNTLTELDFFFNTISTECAEYIADILEPNLSLLCVETSVSCKKIEDFIARNKKINEAKRFAKIKPVYQNETS